MRGVTLPTTRLARQLNLDDIGRVIPRRTLSIFVACHQLSKLLSVTRCQICKPHLQQMFDRGMTPVEVPEIPKLVDYIVEKMYQSDKDQLNSLLESIREPHYEPNAAT